MKYNNQYYKIIAQLLDESVDNQHHTDLYYSKKIAESYGETYTDIGNVNKYLRDFAKDVGVELDNKHHTRLYYLREIAKVLYDGELEHNTENYYLRIISENINVEPPTPRPVTFNLRITNNGTPIANKYMFDMNKQSTKYYTDSNGEMENVPIPILYSQSHQGSFNVENLISGTGADSWTYGRLVFVWSNEAEEYTQIVYGYGNTVDIPNTPYTVVITIVNRAVTLTIETV